MSETVRDIHDRSYLRRVANKLGAAAGAASLILLESCGMGGGASKAQMQASQEAVEDYDLLQMSDIVKCEARGPAQVGPMVKHYGHLSPSVVIPVTVAPGVKYDDEYFRDKGATVEGLVQEIRWYLPRLTTVHEIDDSPYGSGNDIIPGSARIANKKGEFEGDGAQGMFDSIDVTEPTELTVSVPLNPIFEGERIVHLFTRASVELYQFSADEAVLKTIVKPRSNDDGSVLGLGDKGIRGSDCARFSVRVENGRIVKLQDLSSTLE